MRTQYLPLLWSVRQSGAALEHNAVILYLGLHTTWRFNPIPYCISSLDRGLMFFGQNNMHMLGNLDFCLDQQVTNQNVPKMKST